MVEKSIFGGTVCIVSSLEYSNITAIRSETLFIPFRCYSDEWIMQHHSECPEIWHKDITIKLHLEMDHEEEGLEKRTSE